VEKVTSGHLFLVNVKIRECTGP